MVTGRSFLELNLWQRIFAEHWESFVKSYARTHGNPPPEHWEENVDRMLRCGDIREGYYEYLCEQCGAIRKVGFTCKSRLCLRCFKTAIDDWLKRTTNVLFEGVVHRQVVLTIPRCLRPLVLSDAVFMKAFMDEGAESIRRLVEQWRPKQRIRIGMMAVMQLHGRSGTQNPHLHFVVSEGGVDRLGRWRTVNYFDTRKLRKVWQYQVVMSLKKAVRGTDFQTEWLSKLGSTFRRYPSGFDCHCLPEKGPVERLLIYLCKYVSSPAISLRRISGYDGHNVRYRFEDHRRGKVCETLPAVDFIGRMIRNLPPKGFRMVRYYGMYARPVRQKIHDKVANVLRRLVQRAESVARRFGGHSRRNDHSNHGTATLGKAPMRCARCGSTDLILLRIWDKCRGVLYDAIRDGPTPFEPPPVQTAPTPPVARFEQMVLAI